MARTRKTPLIIGAVALLLSACGNVRTPDKSSAPANPNAFVHVHYRLGMVIRFTVT